MSKDLEFIPIDRKFFLDIIGPMGPAGLLILSGPRRYWSGIDRATLQGVARFSAVAPWNLFMKWGIVGLASEWHVMNIAPQGLHFLYCLHAETDQPPWRSLQRKYTGNTYPECKTEEVRFRSPGWCMANCSLFSSCNNSTKSMQIDSANVPELPGTHR